MDDMFTESTVNIPECFSFDILKPVFSKYLRVCLKELAVRITSKLSINSSSPSSAYMRRWTGSTLVQVTSAGILLLWPLRTNFSEILIEIHVFSFKNMHLKLSFAIVAAILSRARWVKKKMA